MKPTVMRLKIIILCLAYLIGLFATGIFGFPNFNPSWQQWVFVIVALTGLTGISAIITSKINSIRLRWSFWLLTGLVAILAVFYFQFRLPRPLNNDISYQLNPPEKTSEVIEVKGKILDEPKLNRKQKARFWLEVRELKNRSEKVTGKLYTTVPILQGTGLHSGQNIIIKGLLYQPQSPSNPGSYDFKKYLASEGSFAGLSGFEVAVNQQEKQPIWGFWQVRQRIIRSQLYWLKSPSGQLLSSMVLGGRAVDLPFELKDSFIKVGLAHILAASGFHVSLLLGMVLFLTRNCLGKTKLVVGLITIITYISLTGFFPSVIRAGTMGIGVLLGIVTERKIRPLGALLLAAILILLVNPLWIWNLGFQLSFLATFGLIVTLPSLQEKLDFIPPTIASIISIPIAASLWTLPLIAYSFNTIPTYSIIVNILATPLVIIISLGGMISGLLGLIYPLAGSALAWLLKYPIIWLINIVKLFEHLPGSSWSIGKISLATMLIIYGLMVLILVNQWARKYVNFVILFMLSLVIIPIIFQNLFLVQVTVFDTSETPVIVVQDRGKTILINSGDPDTVNYTLIPFLTEQGINAIDYGIILEPSEGWSIVSKRLRIKKILENSEDNNLLINNLTPSTSLKLIENNPKKLGLKIKDQNWLIINQELGSKKINNFQPNILVFSGKNLLKNWLENSRISVVITTNNKLDLGLKGILNQSAIQWYQTRQDGAIQWNNKRGFQTTNSRIGLEL
jgi:competence protein ComEC